jgi:hypothetical protein
VTPHDQEHDEHRDELGRGAAVTPPRDEPARRPVVVTVAVVLWVVLGVLLVLDAQSRIDVGFAYVGPSVLAALGAILLASGLASRGRD